jgi:hypothetical protein
MKLSEPENKNYAATVVEIKNLIPIEGSDNIVATTILGAQAIVGRDTKVGDIGLVFPAESQISQEYAFENNLHDHGDLNKDEGAKGYLGDNRRVRAIRLRGAHSTCLFMPLTSLSYLKINLHDLHVGDMFEEIDGHEIVKKYVKPRTAREQRVEKNKDKFIRVTKEFLPEHYSTDQWYKFNGSVPDNATVIVTQKLHGTSVRVGHTVVRRKLTALDRLAKLVRVKVAEVDHDYVFGSKHVIKDPNNPNQQSYYAANDVFTEEGKKLEGLLPKNFLVYAEIIGWESEDRPIQRNYTYQIPNGQRELYVYRVAFVNEDGFICDLSWDQTVEFCRDRGLKWVPELWRGEAKVIKEVINPSRKDDEPELTYLGEHFTDVNFRELGFTQAVPLADESPVDEGVCVRLDGIAPYILKAKGPIYYEHETKMKDVGGEDLEEDQGEENEG